MEAPSVPGRALRTRIALSITFTIYLLVSGYTMIHHELSGDEIHTWNIVKGSATFPDLIHNSRYEGHPPGWYALLWPLSRLTHDAASIQVLHWAIAACVAFLILFRSPLPPVARLLVPFGYYFLFEYAILSRNYAIGVLLGCGICVLLGTKDRGGTFPYYLLLLLMSNTHLLAAVLAGSLHLCLLLKMRQRGRKSGALVGHALLGMLVLLPSVYFIFPPADSALNIASWRDKWSAQQVVAFGQAPLRCFLPVPAWWDYHFWNTQFLLEARNSYPIFRLVNRLVVVLILGSAFYVLRKHKASLVLFVTNLGLSFIIAATTFPLLTARYSGFIYIGFILALWLYCAEEPRLTRGQAVLVHALLVVQVVGGMFSTWKDIQLPFANLFRVVELIKEVPPDSRLVTDYWTMNAYVAFTDKPVYCVDMQRELSFILWDRSLAEALKSEARYSSGFREIFRQRGPNAVHMVSLGSPQKLVRVDPELDKAFRVVLIDKREGAIDKGSDLYLYRICPPETALAHGPSPPHLASR
ncbi:MAG: hypothetical protein NEA02_11890 [Thermoanaerobaculia bacterium]|nr:hypothetical protein [Thermoanaerobaculia bacterium]